MAKTSPTIVIRGGCPPRTQVLVDNLTVIFSQRCSPRVQQRLETAVGLGDAFSGKPHNPTNPDRPEYLGYLTAISAGYMASEPRDTAFIYHELSGRTDLRFFVLVAPNLR